jgi:hypothetical protein
MTDGPVTYVDNDHFIQSYPHIVHRWKLTKSSIKILIIKDKIRNFAESPICLACLFAIEENRQDNLVNLWSNFNP